VDDGSGDGRGDGSGCDGSGGGRVRGTAHGGSPHSGSAPRIVVTAARVSGWRTGPNPGSGPPVTVAGPRRNRTGLPHQCRRIRPRNPTTPRAGQSTGRDVSSPTSEPVPMPVPMPMPVLRPTTGPTAERPPGLGSDRSRPGEQRPDRLAQPTGGRTGRADRRRQCGQRVVRRRPAELAQPAARAGRRRGQPAGQLRGAVPAPGRDPGRDPGRGVQDLHGEAAPLRLPHPGPGSLTDPPLRQGPPAHPWLRPDQTRPTAAPLTARQLSVSQNQRARRPDGPVAVGVPGCRSSAGAGTRRAPTGW
jgi:hypothetical protein